MGMGNRTFHQATIGGLCFEGIISADGPYILCANPNGGVALGFCCALRKFRPEDPFERNQEGWWLVKYGDQAHAFLPGFSDEDAHALAKEFGIVLWGQSSSSRESAFFASPSFQSLRIWVKRWPGLAKRFAHYEAYLPGWHEMAKGDALEAVGDCSMAS